MYKSIALAAATATTLALPAMAQFTYKDCDDLKAADFKKTEILGKSTGDAKDPGMEEPVQMDLHGVKVNGKLDHVDIYYVGRLGQVRHFNGATKAVTDMGKITVWGKNDNGLMGIALDPAFDSNRRLYLWYSPTIANTNLNRRLRLSRFTVKADFKLDMASEKIMIDILASKTDRWHSGGPMQFDKHGDLWVQIGNNSDDVTPDGSQFNKDSTNSDEWGPSNTASMRGGTIRIHPDESEKGYSIPAGNFGEYWAAQFEKQGKAALAAEYRDPKKVLPEVYIKGERSNYSITVHPTKRWVAWGTVNYQSSRDEFTITPTPIFSGFPYFHGDNEAVPGFKETYGFDQVASAPRNMSTLNSGVKDLPPAIPGQVVKLASVAISGPIYAFDPSLDSPTKFPPHLHNSWIGFDFDRGMDNPMWIFNIDTNTFAVTRKTAVETGLFANIHLRRPTQAKYGPEGALYILNYDGFYSTVNPGVMRLDYVGTCKVPVSLQEQALRKVELSISQSLTTLFIHEAGEHELSLYDLAGNRVATLSGKQGAQYSFGKLRAEFGLAKGLHIARVKTARSVSVRHLSIF